MRRAAPWLAAAAAVGVAWWAWRRWRSPDEGEAMKVNDVDNPTVSAPRDYSLRAPPSSLSPRLWGSATAKARDLDNTPPPSAWPNLARLQAAAQALEALYPVRFTSFYRSPAVNAAVGGVPNSRHVEGRAFDVVPLDGDLLSLRGTAESMTQPDGTPTFSVIITERTWLHCEVPA